MSWTPYNDMGEIWNPETLKNYIGYAEDDKTRIENYLEKARKRLKELQSIRFKPVVTLTRDKMDKVYYYVSVEMRHPKNPKAKYYPYGYSKRFAGREKKLAFEYANKIAKELKTEIETNV